MRDIHNSMGAVTAIPAQVITSSAVNGSIIDLSGFNAAEFVIVSGNVTDGSYAATLTEGSASDLSDGTTVASTDLLGSAPSFASTDDNVTKRVGYVGAKRYVRLTLTPTGASTGGYFAAVALKGHAASNPVA